MINRIVLIKNATDLLRAIVEVDDKQFAAIETKALADFGQPFAALDPTAQARVVENWHGGDLDYDFYQCGDTDSASVSEYGRVEDPF